MKRLLCIIDSLNVGGAETFLMKLLRTLPKDEYQFDFVVSKDGGAYSSEVLARGGRIYTVPPRRKNLMGALRQIRDTVRTNGYKTVLRLGDEPIVGLDLVAARLGGAKKLAFRSCNALAGLSFKSRVLNSVMRPVLNLITDVKIAPSVYAAEFTFGKSGARKTHILHNGVDLERFCFSLEGRDGIRQELSLDKRFVVGHIGRFSKQKNHRFLLEIFKEITMIRGDAMLLLVGGGEDEGLIREWIKEFDLEGRVIMAGQRFDIPEILSSMDVFVFPSFFEGMPNTVIEAQATGLPCVISDTITPDADITGLVYYLPLDLSASEWAEKAVLISEADRKDTVNVIRMHGYDIEDVAKEFKTLLFD